MVYKYIIFIISLYILNIANAVEIYNNIREVQHTSISDEIFNKYQREQPTPIVNIFNNTPLTNTI